MRIAYPMRVNVQEISGGDVLQVQRFIEEGKKPGADGLPRFEGSILSGLAANLSSFDLVHLTNIDRPVDTYQSFLAAKAQKKPIFLSPIHHSYGEIERYERMGRDGIARVISRVSDFRRLEYLRSMVRSWAYPELASATLRMMLRGMRESQREVLTGSDRILVLADKEREDIFRDFGEIPEEKFVRLRNGFEPSLSGVKNTCVRDIDVCMVGRIEARKNQVAVLRVLNRMGISGVFVGGENPKHRRYCRRFRDMIAVSKSQHTGQLSHIETLGVMRRARLHISASWFEVSSLVDLEAHSAGCGVVSSKCGGTRELLGDTAEYVDPGSEESIQYGIEKMFDRVTLEEHGGVRPEAQLPVLRTWSEVGDELAKLYRDAVDAH
jgi:glycosyltransferase involved in cell wall biosynthesis